MFKLSAFYADDQVEFIDISGGKNNRYQPTVLHLKGIIRKKSK